MKSIILNIVFLLIGILVVSLRLINKNRLVSCSDQLVWFYVMHGENISCQNFITITWQQLYSHQRFSNSPIVDMAAYIRTQAQEIAIGCTSVSLKVCAVGYEVDNSNFGLVNEGTAWLPSVSAIPICCTCRFIVP